MTLKPAKGAASVGPEFPRAVKQRLQALLSEDPEAPALEFLRQLREEGVKPGESTFYRLYRQVKKTIPMAIRLRFEGVAGEFAQYDFGCADVRLTSGSVGGSTSPPTG